MMFILQTFVALGVVVSAWILFTIVIESSGFFVTSNPASYEKNPTMKVSKIVCLNVSEVEGRALVRGGVFSCPVTPCTLQNGKKGLFYFLLDS
jgi:hypothetical protein